MAGKDAQNRRLGAIVFTDIVSYSALVNRDETLGLRQLDRQRAIVRRLLPAYSGREIETAGDSFLLIFDSADIALRCVAAIQQQLIADTLHNPAEPPLQLRCSVHVGEMELRGREVLGNAVNVAARLMPLSPEGGIALSDQAYLQVRDRLIITARSLGAQNLKNIRHPVEVFVFDAAQIPALPSEGRSGPPERRRWQLPSRSLRNASLAAAVLVVLTLAAYILRHPPGEQPAVDNLRTIAVLPFATLSQGEGDRLLSAGIQDSVLTSLARMPALRVISRTSMAGYADVTTRKLPDIARELGVGSILEGSLQRQGPRILVQAQLIDARTDQHLWAQSYDRKVDDLFAVQNDIARQVASAVSAQLTAPAKGGEQAPTHSVEAYQHYQRAKQLLDGGAPDDYPKAQQALEQALALDGRFALARVALSEVHLNLYAVSADRSEQRLWLARDELIKAAEAQPNLPELHRGWGRYYLLGKRERSAAAAEFETALELMPNDPDVLASAANIHLQHGRMDRALAYQRRSVELNPRSLQTYVDLLLTYELMRDFPSMRRTLDAAARLQPDSPAIPILRARIALGERGDLQQARRDMQGVDYAPALEKLAYYEENWDEVIRQIKRQPDWQNDGRSAAPYPSEMSLAHALWFKGDKVAARKHFRSAAGLLEAALKQPDEAQWDQRSALAVTYAALGQTAAAQQLMAEVLACSDCITPTTRADIFTSTAMTRLMLGDRSGAVKALRNMLSQPSVQTVQHLRLDPAWIPLRDDPAFQKLLTDAPRS